MIKYLYKLLHPKYTKLFLEYKVNFSPRYGNSHPPHPQLTAILEKHRAQYIPLLEEVLQHQSVFQNIVSLDQQPDKNLPAWNNGFLPGLDIVMLYSLLNHYKPKRYIEVGSGNSTKVAHKSIKDNGLQTEIVSIDPYPRAEIDHLANKVIREPLENTNYDILQQLEANDILFIDNSHRMLPNSDATVFFLELLPFLKKGVVVHIHDVFLPYDYPQDMCDRFYSEQYGLACFLLANAQRYQPLMPNYFVSQDAELSKILQPIWQLPNLRNVEQHGCSFWLSIQE